MIVTLLCIMFSKILNFDGLTLQTLFEWYCNHPILFMLAMCECTGMIKFTLNVNAN